MRKIAGLTRPINNKNNDISTVEDDMRLGLTGKCIAAFLFAATFNTVSAQTFPAFCRPKAHASSERLG